MSYVGNVGNAQDLGLILEAAEATRALPIAYVVVGDGIRRVWLEAEVARRALTNVLVLGYLPRAETPWVNASSDICTVLLSPHIQGDGFPSKIFSIMASGRSAIIAADESSDLRLVAAESHCGRVVPVGRGDLFTEAVLAAFQHPDALAEEGRRAREWVVARYSKETIAAAYDGLIGELLGGQAGKRKG